MHLVLLVSLRWPHPGSMLLISIFVYIYAGLRVLMIWADYIFFFWHVFSFAKSRRCDDNQLTTATHFSENKRLHLESSRQNSYIISFMGNDKSSLHSSVFEVFPVLMAHVCLVVSLAVFWMYMTHSHCNLGRYIYLGSWREELPCSCHNHLQSITVREGVVTFSIVNFPSAKGWGADRFLMRFGVPGQGLAGLGSESFEHLSSLFH